MARVTSVASPAITLAIRSAHATLTLAALERADAQAPAGTGSRDAGAGPGWFDSSWDLERGLEVREGLPEDVSLDEWLTVCLRA
jgi:hypothetical protein